MSYIDKLVAYRQYSVTQLQSEVADLQALISKIRKMQSGSVSASGSVNLPDYNVVSEELRAATTALNEMTLPNGVAARTYADMSGS
jgi:hypothetical protein